MSIDNIPLDDMKAAFEGENSDMKRDSSLTAPAPPNEYRRNTCFFSGGFAVKVML